MTNLAIKPLDIETCKTLIILFMESNPEIREWLKEIDTNLPDKVKKHKQLQVMTNYVPERHKDNILKNKWYNVEDYYEFDRETGLNGKGYIVTEQGDRILILTQVCAYLDGGNWETLEVAL